MSTSRSVVCKGNTNCAHTGNCGNCHSDLVRDRPLRAQRSSAHAMLLPRICCEEHYLIKKRKLRCRQRRHSALANARRVSITDRQHADLAQALDVGPLACTTTFFSMWQQSSQVPGYQLYVAESEEADCVRITDSVTSKFSFARQVSTSTTRFSCAENLRFHRLSGKIIQIAKSTHNLCMPGRSR